MTKTQNKNEFVYKPSQLGYFLDFDIWKDALKLLNFQIEQRPNNKHYHTLSIFYYENLNPHQNCIVECQESFFKTKIASGLFYGLQKEFAVYHYVIPKKGLCLRDYIFFTYPARALYYSVGLYILKLSEEFLLEVHNKLDKVNAFYGGKLSYKGNLLNLSKSNIYYRNYYENFRDLIEKEINQKSQYKVILKIDIENYFGELLVPLLLEKLDTFIKPSIKSKLNFDVFTKEQIRTFFEFLMNKKNGIPQSDNNIISGFIGYLFMAFGDFSIDEILKSNKYHNIIHDYKIIRYVDDINILIVFNENINTQKQQGEFTLYIASEIAETLYRELHLRLNLKTRAYHLSESDDEQELLARIKNLTSQDHAGFDYDECDDYKKDEFQENDRFSDSDKNLSKKPQDKLDKIFEELEKLKASNIEAYFIRSNVSLVSEEAFREVFDKSVYNLLKKEENRKKIKSIFDDFNIDLIKVKPFELTILMLSEKNTSQKLKDFLINKDLVTISDADLIVKYLCQTNFEDRDLFNKLSENPFLKDIVQLVLNPKIACEKPGYYHLSCIFIQEISKMPEVIEQIQMRVFYEKNQLYSVALNHLVNEIQAICIRQEGKNKKDYDANSVFNYLASANIPYETRIKIRNLFDRRNNNSVSHPGSNDSSVWEVTQEEYYDYHRYVGNCLIELLLFEK